MYLFLLGVILGVGLVLAVRSMERTLRLRKIHKAHAVELEVQRRVNEKLGISSWDYVPAQGPAGPPNGFRPIRHR
jgi:hypothetical protein